MHDIILVFTDVINTQTQKSICVVKNVHPQMNESILCGRLT